MALDGLLARQPEQHRHIVRSQRPEGILFRAQLAQVEAIAVDVAHGAELTVVDECLQRLDSWVVLEQVPDHQGAAGRSRRRDHRLGVGGCLSERLFNEAVLARLQYACCEVGMGRHGCGHGNRVEVCVGEQLLKRARAGGGEALQLALDLRGRVVAEPSEFYAG
jgi:hypothetical protein